jgi:hypothetical protein
MANLDSNFSKEILSPTPITRLNVAIHPLWRMKPLNQGQIFKDRFVAARQHLAEAVVANMAPSSPGEVTCFIPHIVNSRKSDELVHQKQKIATNQQYLQWTTVFQDLVTNTDPSFRRQLLIAPNLVEIPGHLGQGEVDPDIFVQALAKKGFVITPDTEVVVGGEMLYPCVTETVMRLLEIGEIHHLRVDKGITLTSDYLISDTDTSVGREYDQFVQRMSALGYDVIQDHRIVSIHKRESKL